MYLPKFTLKRFGLILMMICACGVWSAYAQDDDATNTPQPTTTPDVPSFLYNWNAEVLYPAAVRFTIYIDRPLAAIQSIQLNIEPAIGGDIVVNISPAENSSTSETFTLIDYIWQIPANNPLPFLSTVDYTWLITTQQEGANSVPGAFLFEDDRANWIEDTDEEDALNLIFPEGQADPSTIRDAIRPVYELLAENTGRQPTFNFALFDEALPLNPCPEGFIANPLTDDNIPCSTDIIEASLQIQNYEPLQLGAISNSNSRNQVLIRLLVSRFYDELWSNENVPAWFLAGLQNFYQLDTNTASLLAMQGAVRSGNYIRLEAMNDAGQMNWEQQANTMVIYIADQIGLDGLFTLANEAATTDNFTELYEQTTGNSLDSLILDMSDWLFLPSTTSRFDFTLYQPGTPTPEPSATFTPYPPTETNTPTATSTPTVTPSVTGFLSATPLASLTPTPTQRAGTPTVTPRPAGSLIDPTAVPPQTETDENVLNQTQIIAIIAVIGGLIALAAVAVFYRRGKS